MGEHADYDGISDEGLLVRFGADADLGAAQELARRGNPTYKEAFRQACIEVLGEDPDEDWQA